MTWISTLRQRSRRCQRSPAQILIIRLCLTLFLSPNLMRKVGYRLKIPHPLLNKIHGFVFLKKSKKLLLIRKDDTWLLHVTSLLERCWSSRSRCAASLLPRSLVCLVFLLFVGLVMLDPCSREARYDIQLFGLLAFSEPCYVGSSLPRTSRSFVVASSSIVVGLVMLDRPFYKRLG